MKFKTVLSLSAMLMGTLAQTCDNPLASYLGIQMQSAPTSISGAKYCSMLTNSCCSTDTINNFDAQMADWIQKLMSMFGQDPSMIGGLSAQDWQEILDPNNMPTVIDVVRQHNPDIANFLQAHEDDYKKLVPSLQTAFQSLSNNYANVTSDAKNNCIQAWANLKDEAFCLACDPNFSSQGILSDKALVFDDTTCPPIRDGCTDFFGQMNFLGVYDQFLQQTDQDVLNRIIAYFRNVYNQNVGNMEAGNAEMGETGATGVGATMGTANTEGMANNEALANTTEALANTTEAVANTNEAIANTTEAIANTTEAIANTTEAAANTGVAATNTESMSNAEMGNTEGGLSNQYFAISDVSKNDLRDALALPPGCTDFMSCNQWTCSDIIRRGELTLNALLLVDVYNNQTLLENFFETAREARDKINAGMGTENAGETGMGAATGTETPGMRGTAEGGETGAAPTTGAVENNGE